MRGVWNWTGSAPPTLTEIYSLSLSLLHTHKHPHTHTLFTHSHTRKLLSGRDGCFEVGLFVDFGRSRGVCKYARIRCMHVRRLLRLVLVSVFYRIVLTTIKPRDKYEWERLKSSTKWIRLRVTFGQLKWATPFSVPRFLTWEFLIFYEKIEEL